MNDNIEIKIYNARNIRANLDKLITFFDTLNVEKITLFSGEFSDKKYSEIIRWLLNNSIIVVTAFVRDKIIGVAGIRRVRGGFLSRFWPVVRGYTVVKSDYQGRGIGTRISIARNDAMRNVFAFHKSLILKDNVRMIKIVERLGFEFVFEDSKYVYHIKTFNKWLSAISPLFIKFYRIVMITRA